MSPLGKRDRVQLNVRVDREDREKLHRFAPLEERSAEGVVRNLLKTWIAQKEQEAGS